MQKTNLQNPTAVSGLPLVTPVPGFYDEIEAHLSSDSAEECVAETDNSVTAFAANQISDNFKKIQKNCIVNKKHPNSSQKKMHEINNSNVVHAEYHLSQASSRQMTDGVVLFGVSPAPDGRPCQYQEILLEEVASVENHVASKKAEFSKRNKSKGNRNKSKKADQENSYLTGISPVKKETSKKVTKDYHRNFLNEIDMNRNNRRITKAGSRASNSVISDFRSDNKCLSPGSMASKASKAKSKNAKWND